MKAVNHEDPLKKLREHLESPGALSGRDADFDMNDESELELMSPFPQATEALRWLGEQVTKRWRIIDQEALRIQKWHRRVAWVAIVFGTAAIVLAVIQLAVRQRSESLSDTVLRLELFAVAAAMCAVITGLVAKFNRRWLEARCRAERLRMLKFRSLARLGWCKNFKAWQEWLDTQLALEKYFESSTVAEWSRTSAGKIESLTWNNESQDFAKALTAYYRIKRLKFQADFFNSRRRKFERRIVPWRRWSLRIFFVSVFFVVGHALLEELRLHLGLPFLDGPSVACLTMAAIVPIVGVGVRSWFAAFQLPLSASLYSVKHEELVDATDHLDYNLTPEKLLNQMEAVEHNLNLEHREWLRLLLETEWFL